MGSSSSPKLPVPFPFFPMVPQAVVTKCPGPPSFCRHILLASRLWCGVYTLQTLSRFLWKALKLEFPASSKQHKPEDGAHIQTTKGFSHDAENSKAECLFS